jgi:hypothetical protein
MTSTNEWTNIGTQILPVQHRALFLSHLRGEYTPQTPSGVVPEPVEWIDPASRQHPMSHAESIKAVVREFEITPVMKVAYNLTWEADQHTHQPGHGPDSGHYAIVGVQTRKQSMYFIDRGVTITPVLIETPAEPYATDDDAA